MSVALVVVVIVLALILGLALRQSRRYLEACREAE